MSRGRTFSYFLLLFSFDTFATERVKLIMTNRMLIDTDTKASEKHFAYNKFDTKHQQAKAIRNYYTILSKRIWKPYFASFE